MNGAGSDPLLQGEGKVIERGFDDRATAIARQVIADSFVYGYRLAMANPAVLAFYAGMVSIATIHNPARK